jgi:glycerol kinase
MNNSFILSIDQGTSSTKSILFDEAGQVVFKASEPLRTYYIGNEVEQSPDEIYQNVLKSVSDCIAGFIALGGNPENIKTVGISNQRETFVLWNKQGKPLYNAIVWQCKRSVDICTKLKQEGLSDFIKTKTGLIIDPYFSATKVLWLYENNEKIKSAISAGEAYFGTIDTWLLYRLTNGESYYTDYTNASRTMFFNPENISWDKSMLDLFGLSNLNLPEPKPSSYNFGSSNFQGILKNKVSICCMIGDSHSAAFGEGLFSPGMAKATMGTGCSVLMNVGDKMKQSSNGMVSTICWSQKNRIDYALEGIIVSCGSTIEWLKNGLGLFNDHCQIEEMNDAVIDNNGVYIVPAFSGLGAPYWDMNRKASIVGLTFGCNKNHIIRAALESVCYQIKDVISAMEEDSGIKLNELMVDGGITSNGYVVQFLADLLGRPVVRIGITDVSALGAACLAGLEFGIFKDIIQLSYFKRDINTTFPNDDTTLHLAYYEGWRRAVEGITNSD